MKFKIWGMFDSNGKLMWTLDFLKLDVSDDELCECIAAQIYGDNKNKESLK